MPYLQRNIIANLLSSNLIFVVYFWQILTMYRAGRFDGDAGLALLGKSILILIVAGIVVTILITVAFNILYSVAANDGDQSYLVDERDRLIELRGLRAEEFVIGGIFVAAMIALATGAGPFIVINIIVLAFGVGGVSSGLLRLFLYRKGF